MTEEVIFVEVQQDGKWATVGTLRESDPPGSVSSLEGEERRFYVFGFDTENAPCVWESQGMDVETRELRLIMPDKIRRIAELRKGRCILTLHRKDKTNVLQIRLGSVQ